MRDSCAWWQGGHDWNPWSEKKQKPVYLRYREEPKWHVAYDIYQERTCKKCGLLDRHHIVEN